MTSGRIGVVWASGLALCWMEGAALAQAISGVPVLGPLQSGAGAGVEPEGPDPCDISVAGLEYDGTSVYGFRGQDYETVYNLYDTFLIEDFVIDQGFSLHEFRSRCFASGNPFGATDVGVMVFEDNATGLPGQDSYTGRLRLSTPPGIGFFDNDRFKSDFGGQCIPPGAYFVVFAIRLEFGCCGSTWCHVQAGEHSAGGGEPDLAWFWNPGLAYGVGSHSRVVDGGTGEFSGVNFTICGTPNDCTLTFCQADLTGSSSRGDPTFGIKDGDIDSEDFFFFLELFLSDDARASLNGDAWVDADDFFTYLDWFAMGCD